VYLAVENGRIVCYERNKPRIGTYEELSRQRREAAAQAAAEKARAETAERQQEAERAARLAAEQRRAAADAARLAAETGRAAADAARLAAEQKLKDLEAELKRLRGDAN
jgi:membrane protein involved in colicin uptake